MKFLKLKKVLAGTLAFAMFAGCTFGASAATVSSSGSSSSSTSITDETLEQLNDLSWSEYYAQYADMNRYTGEKIVINACDYSDFEYPEGYGEDDAAVPFEIINGLDGKTSVLQTPDIGTTTWTIEVPESGLYAIDISYYPTEAKSANIERTLRINDNVLFSEVRNLLLTKVWRDDYLKDDEGNIIFESDDNGNESRPSKNQVPEWREYTVSDPTGYYNGEFVFYLEKGTNTISLEAQKEPMTLSTITLRAPEDTLTYEEYLEWHKAQGHTTAPEGSRIYIEAETASATSDSTLYPTNNKTSSINSPTSAKSTLINSIGGSNWATLGQWIEWEFYVEESGFYTINLRFSQSTNAGIFVSRRLRLDDEVPFEEANNLEFMYDSGWQVAPLTDGTYEFQFYLEGGKTHKLSLEVTLGNLGDLLARVRNALAEINSIYLKILQITGSNPDSYTNYKFYARIPKEIERMRELANELYAISDEFQRLSGVTSSNTATLENVARILENMAKDSEGQIAKNFEALKSNIGTLGTWINNMQKQALTLDYILIQPAGAKLPKADANFWQDAWYEIQSFFYSFVIDYNSFSSTVEGEDVIEIEVWTVVSREYTQIMRNLIDDDFTKSYPNISVNLKLVAGGALLPASLAGVGPDVMIGTGENTVINYAVRGALLDLSGYDEFSEVCSRFLDEALVPLTVAVGSPDGELATYGIPNTMSFSVMFYRKDIFAELGISVPTTWDEFKEIIPKLQSKNYTLGMTKTLDMFLLQNGGSVYKEEGAKINYDSDIALDSFTTMCEFFTLYRLPISYDASNRFRTGEMPLIFADLTSFYNQFSAFATELKGLWSFTSVPGTVQEDGSVNSTNILTVSSTVIMKDAAERGTDAASFKFIEWWTRSNIQSQYAKELIAYVGPNTKYNTANIEAFDEMDWSASEIKIIKDCVSKLAGVPDMPGAYIISRYVNFAFLAAYNNNASPSDELLGYCDLINKEFERKREELNREFFIPTTYDWS